MNYTRELKTRHSVDVLVAGGGPAGVAAAIAAARQGASVRLIEASTCLGGMGTAGMVPAFMTFTDGVNFLAGGVGRQVYDTLQKRGGLVLPRQGIKAEMLKRVYDDLIGEAGVAVSFQTQLVDVVVEAGRVRAAVCAGKSGLFAIEAAHFVDATGDGDLAVYAGAGFDRGDAEGRTMPGTLCSLWAGIDWATVERERQQESGWDHTRLEQAFRDGVFTLTDYHLPGMWRVGDALGGGNIGHTFDVDGTDEESLTRAFLWARKSLVEFERYYKQYLKGFERMELVATAPLLGVRESRRIRGDYTLSFVDFQKQAVFGDEIGRYCGSVDIHVAKPDKESYDKHRRDFTTLRLGKGESYGIPYRTLLPTGLKNVLVAGRCVSTDRQVQAAIRLMPGCFITGQAAGLAAALAAQQKTDTRGIDVRDLQSRLRAFGAYLPNAAE